MYTRRALRPPLSQFVPLLWYWRGEPVAHARERLLPSGEAELIFNLRDKPICIYDWRDSRRFQSFSDSLLSGGRSQPFVIDTDPDDHVLGIHFRPGGLFPFLGLPASELHNRTVALDTVWRGLAHALREQLMEAATAEARFEVAEAFLLARLRTPFENHPAVAYALQRFCRLPHGITVGSVVESIGLSSRRFIQLFDEQVGLTPKAFLRIRRFQAALRSIHGARRVDWPQVALDCGYYDQAHFIHDFQQFSGLRPTAYLAAHTVHLNHVPLTD